MRKLSSFQKLYNLELWHNDYRDRIVSLGGSFTVTTQVRFKERSERSVRSILYFKTQTRIAAGRTNGCESGTISFATHLPRLIISLKSLKAQEEQYIVNNI